MGREVTKEDCIYRAEQLIHATETFLERNRLDMQTKLESAGLPYDDKNNPIWVYEYKMKLAELYLMRAQLGDKEE